jgi:ribosomal protein L14
MIQLQTIVKIFDNSGVRLVRCIRVEKKHANCIGHVGNVFLGVVLRIKKKNNTKTYFKKGDMVRVILVSSTKETQLNKTGIYFNNNSENIGFIIQPSKKNKQIQLPVASRFDSFLPKSMFQKNFVNFSSITAYFLL